MRKVMMFAINAEKWRWEDVRREEVGEGEKRKLNFCHINIGARWR